MCQIEHCILCVIFITLLNVLLHSFRDPGLNIPLALQGILKAHSRLEQSRWWWVYCRNHTVAQWHLHMNQTWLLLLHFKWAHSNTKQSGPNIFLPCFFFSKSHSIWPWKHHVCVLLLSYQWSRCTWSRKVKLLNLLCPTRRFYCYGASPFDFLFSYHDTHSISFSLFTTYSESLHCGVVYEWQCSFIRIRCCRGETIAGG